MRHAPKGGKLGLIEARGLLQPAPRAEVRAGDLAFFAWGAPILQIEAILQSTNKDETQIIERTISVYITPRKSPSIYFDQSYDKHSESAYQGISNRGPLYVKMLQVFNCQP